MHSPRTDVSVLFGTRTVRMFAYGFLSVVLALYLAEIGFSAAAIGLLLTLTLAGDAVVSLLIATSADRTGRRRMLLVGAFLMMLAGTAFLLTRNTALLAVAAIVGVISPSGNEIGPFLSIEQAALSHLLPDERRTKVFAWYILAGSFATALGALSGGWLAYGLQNHGMSPLSSYRIVLAGYALCGGVLLILFLFLSRAVEVPRASGHAASPLGLHKSKGIVARLSALFALDAFAGGLILQSIVAYWFHVKFGVDESTLGTIFFGANILAGVSALLAARMAARFGLVNTMVFTHIPSNVLLCLVPFMPTLGLAAGLFLVRFSISQMDVPTRQSYTMAVVTPDERSAAAGITTIARSIGSSLSPVLSGLFLANPVLTSAPFWAAGGLKILYDLLLYRSFGKVKPPEEMRKGPS